MSCSCFCYGDTYFDVSSPASIIMLTELSNNKMYTMCIRNVFKGLNLKVNSLFYVKILEIRRLWKNTINFQELLIITIVT